MIEKCKELAREAGRAILDIYDSENFGIQLKADRSPITRADNLANTIICEGLLSAFPDIPIISEENNIEDFENRKKYDQFWMIDPLDGTKEFIHRNGEFTVNIALVKNKKPVLGVVYCPVPDKLAWAQVDEGAFLLSGTSERILEVESFRMEDESLRILCSRSHIDSATKNFLKQLKNPIVMPSGSSWKFIKVAMGVGHLYPRLAPTMEWDTCAAQIVLEEAGGSVINLEDGTPLEYNKPNLKNPNFIAYGGVY